MERNAQRRVNRRGQILRRDRAIDDELAQSVLPSRSERVLELPPGPGELDMPVDVCVGAVGVDPRFDADEVLRVARA